MVETLDLEYYLDPFASYDEETSVDRPQIGIHRSTDSENKPTRSDERAYRCGCGDHRWDEDRPRNQTRQLRIARSRYRERLFGLIPYRQ